MIEIKYDRRKDIDNKYMLKGRALEEAAITFYSLLKRKKFSNNKDRKQNDYFSGEIDIPWRDNGGEIYRITDIKNSYNLHTFWANEDDIKKQNSPLMSIQVFCFQSLQQSRRSPAILDKPIHFAIDLNHTGD